jgi:hypothetical protein
MNTLFVTPLIAELGESLRTFVTFVRLMLGSDVLVRRPRDSVLIQTLR